MDLNLNRTFFPGGPRSALGSAIACGILLGVFEGVGVLLSRVFSEGQRPQMAPRKHESPEFRFHVYPSPRFCSTTCHDTTTSHHFLDSWIAIDAYTYYIFRSILIIDPHSWLNYDVDMSITPLLTSLQCARRWLRIRPVASDYRSRSSRVQT